MTNNKKEPDKFKIKGKPKYIKIGNEYNFFELFKKIQISYISIQTC